MPKYPPPPNKPKDEKTRFGQQCFSKYSIPKGVYVEFPADEGFYPKTPPGGGFTYLMNFPSGTLSLRSEASIIGNYVLFREISWGVVGPVIAMNPYRFGPIQNIDGIEPFLKWDDEGKKGWHLWFRGKAVHLGEQRAHYSVVCRETGGQEPKPTRLSLYLDVYDAPTSSDGSGDGSSGIGSDIFIPDESDIFGWPKAKQLARAGEAVARAGWTDKFLVFEGALYFLQFINPSSGALREKRVVRMTDWSVEEFEAKDWIRWVRA